MKKNIYKSFGHVFIVFTILKTDIILISIIYLENKAISLKQN
jgi:hypothetical protein